MVVSVCPVDIVAAPVDGVWELLTQTSTLPSPPGWRGWPIEHFGAGALHRGVEDSLSRLKRAAEALHQSKEAVKEN